MGLLTLPAFGSVYVDAQIAIYTVDIHPVYAPICKPLWKSVAAGLTQVVSSELILVETLVLPLRTGNVTLQANREALWQQANTRLLPITQNILREASRLRAIVLGLKTPDAIHAATALQAGCALFVTNDLGFKRVPGLPLAILDEVLAAP